MPALAATSAGLLVLEAIERDQDAPSRLVGTVRVAGYRARIVVDSGNPLGVIEHVDVPMVLGAHEPSLRAVVDAMWRWDSEASLALPIDLSQQVSECVPPFPITPLRPEERAALEAASRQVVVEVRGVSTSLAEPAVVRASLVVDHEPMDVVVEIPDDQEGVMRWVSGPSTSTLTRAQLHAIYRALQPAAR